MQANPVPILYHYSKTQHKTLRTLANMQAIDSTTQKHAKDRAKKAYSPGPYYDHISFFLEPVPLDILSKVFGVDHHTWFPGSVLFEHEVQIDKVSLGPMAFQFVETPLWTKMFYDEKFERMSLRKYYQYLHEAQLSAHEKGTDIHQLVEVHKRLQGLTRQAFLDLPSRPNFDDIRMKYAPTVPHVMIYPRSGKIRVMSSKQVVVA